VYWGSCVASFEMFLLSLNDPYLLTYLERDIFFPRTSSTIPLPTSKLESEGQSIFILPPSTHSNLYTCRNQPPKQYSWETVADISRLIALRFWDTIKQAVHPPSQWLRWIWLKQSFLQISIEAFPVIKRNPSFHLSLTYGGINPNRVEHLALVRGTNVCDLPKK